MKRSLVLGLLLIVLVTWSFPSSLAQPDVQKFTLENGLKVLIIPKPGTGITAVDIWVNVGSLNETREISGISHFFEHMLFKGTEKRPGGIDKEIEALGGRTNAATSYDFTHYYIILPSEHTELALDIIADITQNASFPDEEIAREKEVVLREQDQRTDDPGSFAFFTMRQDFYTVHPYKLPIIGFADSLGKLTREDFLNWMKTYYVPNNMTLVVAGDIETRKDSSDRQRKVRRDAAQRDTCPDLSHGARPHPEDRQRDSARRPPGISPLRLARPIGQRCPRRLRYGRADHALV
jgi:predicted Zn-dependent peptidase